MKRLSPPTLSAQRGRRPTRGLAAAAALCVLSAVASACFDTATQPQGGEDAFLVIIANTGGPAELAPSESWTANVRRLNPQATPVDSTFGIAPGDTVTLRLPLDTYEVTLDGIPISCEDRNGLRRSRFLSQPEATFVMRFNVFCNTFLAMNVISFAARDAELDEELVYRLYDDAGEVLEVGLANAVDTVLFAETPPGRYALELSHVEPRCIVTSDGGPLRRFEVGERRAAIVNFELVCSNLAERPQIVHLESSYRDGVNVFYMEAIDPDPDGAGPRTPDIEAYHWALTDCAGNVVRSGVPRRGLSRYGTPTRAQDTVRLSVAVDVGLPDEEMAGRCTSLRVSDLGGNSSTIVQERFGNEVGAAPVDRGSTAFVDPTGRIAFSIAADDPDGDFAGSFQRFVFRDGTFGPIDGRPDVIARNSYGYPQGISIPSFAFTDFPFTLEDLLGVQTVLIDREGNWSLSDDSDLAR